MPNKSAPFHLSAIAMIAGLNPTIGASGQKAVFIREMLTTTTVPPGHCDEVIAAIDTKVGEIQTVGGAYSEQMLMDLRDSKTAVIGQRDANAKSQNGHGTQDQIDPALAAQQIDQDAGGDQVHRSAAN